ncbi:MAG: A/G-specific adenine glycosylase [Phycisphaerae bacterium]|nr:A/G-specific adenine glycosylase [Phycisphaerae bacterium]
MTTRSPSTRRRNGNDPAATAALERPREVAAAVEAWFARAGRTLPWREVRTGYTALVSEFMLQQTQVSRVVPKFEEFMRRFPTVAALAAADEQAVLAAWQGLGYYRRARLLHAAAKAIVERFGGRVPETVDDLVTLPGVGRYTAGSIASIAFGQRVPIVDTNVARVLLRVAGREGASGDPAIVAWAWDEATRLVEAASDPARLNEGLMELGATVCPASTPACLLCPLAALCRARANGEVGPVRAKPTPTRRTRVYHHVVVVRRGDELLLERRASTGLWASMWQAPTVEHDSLLDVDELAPRLALRVTGLSRVREFEHQTSHRTVVFVVHEARTRSRDGTWAARAALAEYPLSNPMRRILADALTPPSPNRPVRARSS